MRKPPTPRLLWIWIACCAILMNAIAPSVSHALAFAKGQPSAWDICRGDDAGLAKQRKPGKPGKPGMVNMTDCVYCVSHAGSFGLPPGLHAALGMFGAQPSHPFLFYRAPAPLAAWSASQPRGPPHFI